MGVHAIRLSAFQAANRSERAVFKWGASVSYGSEDGNNDPSGKGAGYLDGSGNEWRVFSDQGITLADTANMTTLAGGLAAVNLPAAWIDTRTRQDAKQAVIDYVTSRRAWPIAIPEGTADPHVYVRSQQPSPPAWFQAASAVPASWTPITSE